MKIHPTAVVSGDVELGERVVLGPHVVVLGPCIVGDDVQVGAGCVIGTPPELTSARQNVAWAGDPAHHGVKIGPGTIVRELCTIQQGALAPTRVGSGCWLLTRTYVAHDCMLGDGVTTSAGVALGGHVRIGDGANLGMNATVHQRRVVGPGTMVGMSAVVTRDVPPFAKVYGSPARVRGANTVGAVRRGVGQAAVDELDRAYRTGSVPELREDCDPVLAAAGNWWAATRT